MPVQRTSAAQWAELLNLSPHPEGGWYRETYRAKAVIDCPEGFDGERSCATAIYFLLTSQSFSAFHRILSDEVWHFYTGDGITVHEIAANGAYIAHRLGASPGQGEVFQLVIPAGSWFASEVSAGGDHGLVGCTVAPGFDFRDFEMAKRKHLLARFPQHSEVISRLCRD
ncbi:MAG: cupin domain-containing protein [Flavobacteriales bacterium]|nr:cupin domain-containing protein [Flavobacteriales bacterium]